MSTADFLFQNSAPSAWTSPSYNNTQSPDWWQAASKGLIARANQVAGQDYQPYSGPRIAGLEQRQKDAIANSGNYIPEVNLDFSTASNNLKSAGDTFDQSQFNEFMSPYTTGVVDRIADLGRRNLSEKLLPEVNDTFIKAGQFGSSRNTDFTLRALRDTNESIMGQQATALQDAQNKAMENFQTAKARELEAGRGIGALAQMQGAEARSQTQNQIQTGELERILKQQNLDLATKDFEQQVNYPQQQLQLLNSIIRGYQPTGSTTTTSYKAYPNESSTSPLTAISEILKSWNGSNSSPTSAAVGAT